MTVLRGIGAIVLCFVVVSALSFGVDGILHATVAKQVVSDSPKVDVDEFDRDAIRRHYGLDVEFDPN